MMMTRRCCSQCSMLLAWPSSLFLLVSSPVVVAVGDQGCWVWPIISMQESYRTVLYEEVVEMLKSEATTEPSTLLSQSHRLVGEGLHTACLLSLFHSYWMHANMGLLLHLPK